jgi:hypothetical protein
METVTEKYGVGHPAMRVLPTFAKKRQKSMQKLLQYVSAIKAIRNDSCNKIKNLPSLLRHQ